MLRVFDLSKECLFKLDYCDSLIGHYRNLSDLPGFVLLESQDRVHGRYDIVTACPYDTLSCSSEPDAIPRFLETLKTWLPVYDFPSNLPFKGGAIGFFTYDFGAHLLGIASDTGEILAELAAYDWAIVVDHRLREVTLVAANRNPATVAVLAEVKTRWNASARSLSDSACISPLKPLITRDQYQQSFDAIYEALQAGRCYQVNYTQPFEAVYEGDPWALYERIRLTNPVPYAAFLNSTRGAILSFSPERLVSFQQGNILASPIKGSIARSQDSELDRQLLQSLHKSEKNRAENTMIVDLLRNDLSKIARPHTVKVRGLCVPESYACIHHLVSHIQAQPRADRDALDIFLACFPGASITGAPKEEAMRMIYALEPHRRGIYCGSIGYFSAHGGLDMNIAIRTLVADGRVLRLSAGGGIVIDSDREDEYAECLIKLQAIQRALYC